MLIDIKRKIIFIAGVKTGSTTIENIFEKKVDIRIVRSEWGKHNGIADVKKRYPWIFEIHPISEFFIWGVVREPFDWLHSMYRSHKDDKFSGNQNLYTGNISFEKFINDWRDKNVGQSIPQHDRFSDEDGKIAVSLLIPFDRLREGINMVAPKYGEHASDIPHLNRSPRVQEFPELSEALTQKITQEYALDIALYQRVSEDFRRSC